MYMKVMDQSNIKALFDYDAKQVKDSFKSSFVKYLCTCFRQLCALRKLFDKH